MLRIVVVIGVQNAGCNGPLYGSVRDGIIFVSSHNHFGLLLDIAMAGTQNNVAVNQCSTTTGPLDFEAEW